MATLEKDYKNFLEKGGGDTNNAKHYNNVINSPLLDIPLDRVKRIKDKRASSTVHPEFRTTLNACMITHTLNLQICLPGLHMSLGIYERLWELLTSDCTKLDLLLAQHSSVCGTQGISFQTALKKKEDLAHQLTTAEQRVITLDQLVTFVSLHAPILVKTRV